MHFQHKLKQSVKKLLALLVAAIAITIVSIVAFDITPIGAQPPPDYGALLTAIKADTGAILLKVNDLPTTLASLLSAVTSVQVPDNPPTSITTDLQTDFTKLGNTSITNLNQQNALQPSITTDLFFGVDPTKPTMPNTAGPDAGQLSTLRSTLPNANDLLYPTILGQPLFAQDPRNPTGGTPPAVDPLYNYIRNASGLAWPHSMPLNNWGGNKSDQLAYRSYYNTIMAIQSFNSYILSNLYIDGKNGNQLTNTQNALVLKATAPNWLAQVAGENIGVVIRHILVYQSQSFVALTQLLQTQKQLLAAQIMNNTLFMLSNQINEKILIQHASGAPAVQ